MKPQGLLLVLSGPSGAGKGTICQMLREKLPDLAYSVSVTTRQARNGEVDGVNYFFKSVEEVKQMIAEGELLEYAEVYGNYYGTPRSYVMELLNQGKDVILEIDIQGAMQIKKRFPDGVFVFINEYDYIVVNDVAQKATSKVLTIMEAERYRAARTYFIINEICHAAHK